MHKRPNLDGRRKRGAAAIRPSCLISVELQTLITVFEHASFSAAARFLQVEQSTVSRRVRDLEDRLGVSLCERYQHGIQATLAGKVFLTEALRSRDILEAAVDQAQRAGSAQVGELKLGFVWSFASGAAQQIISQFRLNHPQVRMHLTELGDEELVKLTLNRQIDCAWIVTGRIVDPALLSEPLWTERLHLAEMSAGQSTGWQARIAFANAPYLRRSTESWATFNGPCGASSSMDVRTHSCSRESLLSLVAAGDGVTVLPESIASAGYPGVRFVLIDDVMARLQVHAVWRRETDNPVLRRFMALTRDWVRQHQPSTRLVYAGRRSPDRAP